MLGRKKRSDDRLGPSTGWVKWATKFFRFILYPFIHPLWFFVGVIIVLTGVVAWPAYNGVEFADMPEWYKKHIVAYYEKAQKTIKTGLVTPLKEKAEKELQGIVGSSVNVKTIEKKPGKDEIVSYDVVQNVNRRMFEKAQDVPVDVKATMEKSAGLVRNDMFKYRRNDNIGLTYLDVPQDLQGVVEVINANELKINETVLFLYGVYADPASKEGIAAMQYLQNNVGGKNVICKVIAYTQGATATAICVYEGMNINQQLVDLGYSKDVSLN